MIAAFILTGFLTAPAVASASATASFAGRSEMGGLSLSSYPDFERRWKLVTVRFRRDTGEMRLTYADPKAYKVLMSGKTDYPDGAVFAKIGMMTHDDPAFVSSAVPSGARRYQLMVREKKKFKDTDGWGYALFDGTGKTFEDDPKIQVTACHACHKIVPERGFVFSQPMLLGLGKSANALASLKKDFEKLKFAEGTRTNLPPIARDLVPANFRTISRLEGELTKFLFVGTLEEVRPMLAREAKRAGRPAALVSEKNDLFSLVIPEPETKCEDQGKPGIMMNAWMNGSADETLKKLGNKPFIRRFCQTD